jgi:hypothetical protein
MSAHWPVDSMLFDDRSCRASLLKCHSTFVTELINASA